MFEDFLLFDPVLGGVPDSAFEGCGVLVVVLGKSCDVIAPVAPQQSRCALQGGCDDDEHGE